MKTSVITFPGSNCDRDVYTILKKFSDKEPVKLWHKDTSIANDIDLIVIPGGFSYGDYLRSGAISAKSPIMSEVIKKAKDGVHILGICNGFQILTETGLLDGTLIPNKNLKFICKSVNLQIANNDSSYTNKYKNSEIISLPIAHHDGNFFADKDTIKKLEDNQQIAFRYCDENGNINENSNPNGSLNNIAGIFNEKKNILGMMPHPERACDEYTTAGSDGIKLFGNF